MIIQKLTIYNFRSYYGKKEFSFSPGLNLIIGSNGDGKTTFFDAMNWVLTPDYAAKNDYERFPDDTALVSAKMFKELSEGGTGKVIVSLEIKNNDRLFRIIERTLTIKKVNGEIRIEGRSHKAYKTKGMSRIEMPTVKDVFEKENSFPAVIKKYHLFKGEDKLNIFNEKKTLQTLVDMFSDVKDLDPFKAFARYSMVMSGKRIDDIKDKTNRQNDKLIESQSEIRTIQKKIENAEMELVKAKRDIDEACKNIESIDSDYEIIKKVSEKEKEVGRINNEILRLSDQIDEEYSFKLLDKQWILLGFAPVMKLFKRKLDSLATSKYNLEEEYRRKQEDEYNKEMTEKARNEIEKIAWNRHDINKMKYMLQTHRCTFCGTEAPEGSIAFDFIKQRLAKVMELLNPKSDTKRPEYKRLFKYRNIEELKDIGAALKYTGKDIDGINDEIESKKAENSVVKEKISKKNAEVESLEESISLLYATSTSGENLKDYVSNFSVINKWYERKENASVKMNTLLTKTLPELKKQLENKKSSQSKIAKSSGLGNLVETHEFFRLLENAFENTEDEIYKEFLDNLSKEANVYLSRLNVDDFTGVIKIYLDVTNDIRIELTDKNNRVIKNPNTSLLTTMHISILFAISNMTSKDRDAEYPLIFDAPTSSFDEGKDKSFYQCLNNHVDKQCIVVTKSFLFKNEDGEYDVDKKALQELNCKKFRIKKESGFDKLDITTIDTKVEELKID